MWSYRLTSQPLRAAGAGGGFPAPLAGAQGRTAGLFLPHRVPALGWPRPLPPPKDALFSGRLPGTSSAGAGLLSHNTDPKLRLQGLPCAGVWARVLTPPESQEGLGSLGRGGREGWDWEQPWAGSSCPHLQNGQGLPPLGPHAGGDLVPPCLRLG